MHIAVHSRREYEETREANHGNGTDGYSDVMVIGALRVVTAPPFQLASFLRRRRVEVGCRHYAGLERGSKQLFPYA